MLNRDMKEFVYEGAAIIGQIKESKVISDHEAELTKRIKDKEVFVVKISGMRKEDDEVTAKVIGDYMGIIPKAQVSNRTYIRNKMDELIGQNVPVIVKSFDPETKIVQLSRVEAIKELRKSFLDEILPTLEEINKDGLNYKNYLTKHAEGSDPYYNKYPIVKAKVINYDVENKRVYVNVAGLDIIGNMNVSMFDYRFIYNPEKYLEEYMKPNTVIDVALLAYFDNSKDKMPSSFVVSRRHALPNPWHGIESKIRVGDTIVVKALEKRDSHFFGSYDNFPLDIKCYYPEIPQKNIGTDEKYGRRLITPGHEYKVKVEIVNSENKILTASYLGEL